MLESRFIFVAKVLFLAFIVINVPNFFPVNISNPSYFLLFTTTIFDTTTLLVLSISISKYIHLKNLNLFEDLNSKEDNKNEFIGKINKLKNQIITNSKISFAFTIIFLIMTLFQPIILIFKFNVNEINSSNIVQAIEREFNYNKQNIENEILSNKSPNINNLEEIDKLQNNIIKLENIKDNSIKNLIVKNNIEKFNNTKIVLRNFILGLLWTFVFYKLCKL